MKPISPFITARAIDNPSPKKNTETTQAASVYRLKLQLNFSLQSDYSAVYNDLSDVYAQHVYTSRVRT